MSDPVRVLAILHADQGKGPAQVAAFEQVAPLVRAEDGCRAYDLHAVIGDPDSFVVVEEWASGDALEAHLASAHMAAYAATVGVFRSTPAEVLVLGHERIA